MKKNYSNEVKYGLALVVALSLFGSIAVFAADNGGSDASNSGSAAPLGRGRGGGRMMRQGGEGNNGSEGNGGAGGNICARISDMAAQAEQKVTQIKTPQDRLTNWEEKSKEHDAKLAALRTQWDSNRSAQFTALEAKAMTDAQKKAVTDFEATTKTAISVRRAAIDAAMSTFRVGVKNLIGTREQGVSGDRTAFEAAIKAAYDTVQADCQKNVDPATVKTNLKNAIVAARSKFKLDKQAVPKVGADIQALIATRKQAVEKALADFKTTMETARASLKKAFPADTSSTPETPVTINTNNTTSNTQ